MILGHSSGKIGEVYGGPEVRLKLARDGLERALKVELELCAKVGDGVNR